MESLGGLMKRITGSAERREYTPEEWEAIEAAERDREPSCATCGGRGYVRRNLPPTHPDVGEAYPCPDCVTEISPLVAMQRTLPLKLKEADMHQLQPPPNASDVQLRAWEQAKEAAVRFATDVKAPPWLALSGPVGTGKTYMAAAILSTAAVHGETGLFVSVPEFMAQLKQGFQDGSTEARMQGYQEAPLLCLDDLGAEYHKERAKESGPDWADSELFRLFDHRYAHRLRTIVTSNIHPENLDERIRDRLLDKHMTVLVDMTWQSYRTA